MPAENPYDNSFLMLENHGACRCLQAPRQQVQGEVPTENARAPAATDALLTARMQPVSVLFHHGLACLFLRSGHV